MSLTKAQLINADTNLPVVSCQFNPTDLTISKSNNWTPLTSSTTPLPDMKFAGEGPSSFTLTLWFDTYEQRSDVRKLTDLVTSLMDAKVQPPGSSTNVTKRPPHVMFTWGTFSTFPAIIQRIEQKFVLFLDTGIPARAQLTVALQEVPTQTAKEQQRGQNPTSRAAGASRVRVVQLGDTIDLIAAEELGNPTAWRRIAEANNLDDPRRLARGRALVIPVES